MRDMVTTLDQAHIPSCIQAQYRLRTHALAAVDGVMTVYAAAGGADLAHCLALRNAQPPGAP